MELAAKILVVDDDAQNLCAWRKAVVNDDAATLSIPGALSSLAARRMPLPSLHTLPTDSRALWGMPRA